MTDETLLTLLLRLAASVIAGGLLGLNRELHGKPAGLRTYSLVTLGAAIATLIVARLGTGTGPPDSAAMSRVVQGVLTGVGFLGAGVILRDSSGHVTGLTTAAAIWAAAVLGILCGLGDWPLALVALGLVLLVLHLGGAIERLLRRRASAAAADRDQ